MQATQRMPDLKGLSLFDSCVTLGRIVHSSCSRWLSTGEGGAGIIEMLDRYGIAEALVHDHHARLLYPREHGNRRLLREIEGLPRLHPVWVLEPPKRPGSDAAKSGPRRCPPTRRTRRVGSAGCDGQRTVSPRSARRGPRRCPLHAAKAVVEEMLSAGVRVARLRMRPVPPLRWLWEDLCSALEEHRVPCLLDFGGVHTRGAMTDQDVNGVREIALAHPELPLVLSHVMGGLGIHPAVVPLVRRVENVHLDTTGILEHWREVAREVGPERVLFATGAPFVDPGILISNVQYARGLDEEAKRLICGDNLRRLIGNVR